MDTKTYPYAGYHYPTVIISHAVRLYFRFTLSLRDVEELLTSRGVIVTDKLKSDGADTRTSCRASNTGNTRASTTGRSVTSTRSTKGTADARPQARG